MKMAEVLELLGVTYVTLYRYMKTHPKLKIEDHDSLTGHSFPQPTHKVGRELIWDDADVRQWVEDNAQYVGKRATKGVIINMPYLSMRIAMRSAEIPEIDAPSEKNKTDKRSILAERKDDLMTRFKILGFDGDEYKLEFASVDEAIYFKLKYSLIS